MSAWMSNFVATKELSFFMPATLQLADWAKGSLVDRSAVAAVRLPRSGKRFRCFHEPRWERLATSCFFASSTSPHVSLLGT
jgi:hypothetical protein